MDFTMPTWNFKALPWFFVERVFYDFACIERRSMLRASFSSNVRSTVLLAFLAGYDKIPLGSDLQPG